jgi:[ribosomal protein S18]-alanine N-acetyltransferase
MPVREAELSDLAAVMAIQRAVPEAAQWQQGDYERLLADANGLLLVAEIEAPQCEVVGFVAALRLGSEAELRNLAVQAQFRRKGIARALVEEAHRRLQALGVAQVDLEVRRSNVAARALYEGRGYAVAFERRGYYNDPPEDALVLRINLVSAM